MTDATASSPAAAPDAAAATAAAKAAAASTPGTAADLSIGGDDAGAGSATPLKVEPTGPTVVEFNATGDAGLDMALGFIGKLGIGPGDKAFDAAAAGDFGMLKAKMAGMGDSAKGYEQYLSLAEQAYAKGAESNAAKVAKDVAAIHTAVGGADQWKAIQTWASANAEPNEKVEVNAALKAGGVGAKAMAMWLASKFAAASGTTIEPAEVLSPGAGGKAPASANGALSAKDYATEVQQARAKMGFKFEGSAEYKSLMARRTAGQRAGL